MEKPTSQEHVLHENPYIAEITAYIEAHHPQRAEQLRAIDIALLADGLMEIQTRYGNESDNPKQYHNFEHTADVFKDFCMYADVLELDAQECADGALAAVYHDWEQDMGPGLNEAASATELGRRMEQAGYSIERQVHAQQCILVTDVEFDESGLPTPKNLMKYDPDRTLLAVSLADMNGIALRGERTMVDHAYRLVREIHHVSFEQVRENPRELISMLAKQFFYVGDVLTRLKPAVRHHVVDAEKVDEVLAMLDATYNTQSSMAINAAKTVYELVQVDPARAVQQLTSWGSQCATERQYLAGLQRYTTKLALGRLARGGKSD